MELFDVIGNEAFFRPLTSRHQRLYYECIRLLIDRSKSLPVVYESTARDDLNAFLNNKQYIGVDEDTGSTLNGALILTKFRECGWLAPRDLGRNGEYVVEIAGTCRRIMDFFQKLTEKIDDGEMSNRIFSMYEMLFHAFDEDNARKERPYANFLVPLSDHVAGLKNELADLKEHIAGIMNEVIRFQDLNSFGQYILKDEMLERFFSEYFFIKNNGMIPMQLSFIKERIHMLKDSALYDRMIAECMEKLGMLEDEAGARVDGMFSEIQYFLSEEYMGNMDLIDLRINTYYRLANTRIALMSGDGLNLETAIHGFLVALSEMDEPEQEKALENMADAVRIWPHRYIGTKSFEKKKETIRDTSSIGLQRAMISDEMKKKRTDELFRKAPNRYSVKRSSEYLSGLVQGDEVWSLKGHEVRERSEALMLAASMMYSGSPEFPFEVEVEKESVDTGVAQISNMKVKRREVRHE